MLSAMPHARANGVDLYYESVGAGPPLLLVMGVGAQLVLWPDGFCEALANRGYRVIRFDNRDVGLSTRLHDAPVPNVRKAIVRWLFGLPVDAPYTLSDMAADTAGLIEALGYRRAHVVGASMGGAVAQVTAAEHPERVATLTSIMATTGHVLDTLATPRATMALLSKPGRTREEAIERALENFKIIGSPGFPFDAEGIAHRSGLAFDRGAYPRGFARQLAATMASGNRRPLLRTIRCPTLVIHGDRDPLQRLAGGKATARAIPGARLKIIPGMGHTLPRAAWNEMADAIDHLARQRPLPSTAETRASA